MARPTIFTHRKFLHLRHLTGLSAPAALGHLECLWHVAYQSGDPIIGNSACVELAAQWDGGQCPPNGAGFCAALLESGFIEEVGDGVYSIHDLYDHAPDYVRKRMDRENARKSRKNSTIGRRKSADNGGQCQKTAPNVRPPTPAPTPTQEERGDAQSGLLGIETKPLSITEFKDSAAALAQEFARVSANPRNSVEKDERQVEPVIRDLMTTRGISASEIRNYIQDPLRPKTQKTWEFVKFFSNRKPPGLVSKGETEEQRMARIRSERAEYERRLQNAQRHAEERKAEMQREGKSA